MSRLQSLIAVALIISAFSPKLAHACGPLPFDAYLSQTESDLLAKDIPDSQRSHLARLLAEARNGSGPKWHGVRQRSLNEAQHLLGLREAKEAPLNELGPTERASALRRLAHATLADADALAAEKERDLLRKVEFRTRRLELVHLLRSRDWQSVITRGAQLQVDLGAVPPAKC